MASSGCDAVDILTQDPESQSGSPQDGHKTFHYYGERVSATQKEVIEITVNQNTSSKRHRCHICGNEFITEHAYSLHGRIHRGIQGAPRCYQCGICSKEFAMQSDLKRHEVIHTAPQCYQCGICSKEFAMQSDLKHHEVIHTDVSEPVQKDIKAVAYEAYTSVCSLAGAVFHGSLSYLKSWTSDGKSDGSTKDQHD